MIICDRATYDAAVMAHKKYEPFLNKSIDHYDEMALVVGKDKATRTFARTFADIDLDDGNQDSVPIDGDNEEIEEVRTNVSSSGTSKRKRKNVQESVVDEQIKFVGEQLGKIANALEQFTADKTPHLYEEVMSVEEEGFHDDFLYSVFDYLAPSQSGSHSYSSSIHQAAKLGTPPTMDAIGQKPAKRGQIERQIVELGPNHKDGKAKDLTSILTL
ncbi:hypothetical protein PVK06_024678 [Gossypium arboreum]|uniref:Uncharacterized protein n=1 Tax=Gossypium arboreum TaxID=29729 RepID=A0ABR0PEL1_GOSAR|nr:hypothetical protein PVK06_024678 [Gossypium arboreum]